jgi:hypothetical protein
MKARSLVERRLCVEQLEDRLAPSATVSTNWSGYAVAASPGTVTSVSGTWVVPAVTGTGTAYSSTWVGIDGFSSPTVEQIGTDSDVINGRPVYYAWFEMYPSAAVGVNLNIHPGDTISASVSYSSNAFTLQITDGAQSFSITRSAPTAQRSSAEWIEEAPSSFSGVLPLANFGTVTFSGAQATIAGTTGAIDNAAWSSQVQSINMVNRSGATQARTSALTDSGATSSFSVTYVPTTTTTPPHHGRGFRQNDVPTTSTSGTTTSTQSDLPALAFQATMPPTIPPSTMLPIPAAATGNPSSPFNLAGPAPVAGAASAAFTIGGSAEQAILAWPSLSAGGGRASGIQATPRSNPDAAPAATPESQREEVPESTTPTDAWRGPMPLSVSEALLEQDGEDGAANWSAQDVVFTLALGGVWGIGQERLTAWQRRRDLVRFS